MDDTLRIDPRIRLATPAGCKVTALVMQLQVPTDEAYDKLLAEAQEKVPGTVTEHFGGKHFTCLHAALPQAEDDFIPLYLDVLRPGA